MHVPAKHSRCPAPALPFLLIALSFLILPPPPCAAVPIPPLEVSAPNTWGRVIFRTQWIDPNTLQAVPCRRPGGRCFALLHAHTAV